MSLVTNLVNIEGLMNWNADFMSLPWKCWKCRSREVITTVNIFPFSAYSATGERSNCSLFLPWWWVSLKWNFCLFEQEGTGINYKVYFSLFICSFPVPPGANTVLEAFNVYLTCSSPASHWILSLWTPCYHQLEAFCYDSTDIQPFWMSDGSAAVSICSPQMSSESPSLAMTIRRVVSKPILTLFYCRGEIDITLDTCSKK